MSKPRKALTEEQLQHVRDKWKTWRRDNAEQHRAYSRAYYQEHKERIASERKARRFAKSGGRTKTPQPILERRRHLRRSYGLTMDQYRDMVVGQAARCLICLRVAGSLDVDHDHATGKVRGLLCQACNRMLGQARDDVSVLQAAVRYLSR